MAGSTLTYPLNGAANWEAFPDIVQKIQAGFMRVSLTNFGNNSEPQVEAGSLLDVNGTVCVFSATESITGWSGISAGSEVYIYVVESTGTVTVEFSTTAPTYSAAKRGYYNGNNRCIGGLYKVSATKYAHKWMYPGNGEARIKDGSVAPAAITFDGTPVEDAFYGPPVTLDDPVGKAQPILFLHNRYGSGSNYVFKKASVDLSPWNGQKTGVFVVYLGDDLYAHAITQIENSARYTRLRFYEHNWGSTSWTQRGSITLVTSASSNYDIVSGLFHLGDSGGTAQIAILTVRSTTGDMRVWTYSFNKSTYAASQIGSMVTLASVNTNWLYMSCRAFCDAWQRFWVVWTDSTSGALTFAIWDHNGDGTYTQVDSLTIYASGQGNMRYYGVNDPIKLSSTKYRWIISTLSTSQLESSGVAYLFAVDFEDQTDTISCPWKAWRESGTYPYMGFHSVRYANGNDRILFAHVAAPIGPNTWAAVCQTGYTSTVDGAFREFHIGAVDRSHDRVIDLVRLRFATATGTDTTLPWNFIRNQNGLFVIAAPMKLATVSDYFLLVWSNGERAIGIACELQESGTSSIRSPGAFDNTYDGRIVISYEINTYQNERSFIIYCPICLGIADADYIAGDVVRPLIRGKIRGMSSLVAHAPLGSKLAWQVTTGEVDIEGAGAVPIGRLISDDVAEIDVPMMGYGYQSKDQRLS